MTLGVVTVDSRCSEFLRVFDRSLVMLAAATRAAEGPFVQRGGWQATSGQGVAELLRTLDAVSALGALTFVFLTANLQQMPLGLDAFLLQRVSVKNIVVVGVFLFVWRQIFVLFGLYDATRALDHRDERARVIAACSIGSVTLLALPLVSTNSWFQPWHIVAVGLIAIAGGLVSRQLVWLGARTSSPGVAHRVLIVGTGPRAVKLYEETCMRQPSRYVLVGSSTRFRESHRISCASGCWLRSSASTRC